MVGALEGDVSKAGPDAAKFMEAQPWSALLAATIYGITRPRHATLHLDQ
jgi:hypothetical protein